MPMFFLYNRMSGAGISQSSMASLGSAGIFLIFLDADSSAEEALALGCLNVFVGDDDTDLDDFEGLLWLLELVRL